MLDYVKNNTRLMREWHYEKNKEIDINNIPIISIFKYLIHNYMRICKKVV